MAKSIMIQGTMSNVGKSVLAAALCRILKEDGYKTAPFKSQNMALNSYITRDGLEMGRAQVMQAEAAGIEPSADMNPILLKPTSDIGSQVIVRGKPLGMMSASEYYKRKKEFIPSIKESYKKLEEEYDVIVIEGAGSPAEINLKKDDIVNMGFAEMADAPVLLVGDIDRGGVFAQLAGTILLLEEEERKRIKGVVVNKFRGDRSILQPGLRLLEEKIEKPVLGVVPYFHLDLDEEDSLTERFQRKGTPGLVKIAVIRLPRISNFTDIAPFEALEEAEVTYVASAAQFGEPDVVIVPGSKNTISDLLWMRQNGLEGKVLRHAAKGGIVFGICGGYQMLGESISDPTGAEQKGTVRGMGLLPVKTVFAQEKRRVRVTGKFARVDGALAELSGVCYEGYEIHMGKTVLNEGTQPLVYLQEGGKMRPDGAQHKQVYGCYMHGLFDMSETVRAFLTAILKQKGIDPSEVKVQDRKAYKEEQYEQLAAIVRENLQMETVYRIIEKGNEATCSLSFE
ncbi:cobyric acid synthase [Mediterraneibacter sp.]|uniref:cobyric acid synthase n=1 Tax=Mediterraneibacter sp. TaxID=2316022 RepID=UPI0027B9DC35|nr:cobyric acid synthase [Mediterraneibacter sp.]